jgi:hypothetical protein
VEEIASANGCTSSPALEVVYGGFIPPRSRAFNPDSAHPTHSLRVVGIVIDRRSRGKSRLHSICTPCPLQIDSVVWRPFWNPARWNPARWNPARWNPARWNPARWNPARSNPARSNPARFDQLGCACIQCAWGSQGRRGSQAFVCGWSSAESISNYSNARPVPPTPPNCIFSIKVNPIKALVRWRLENLTNSSNCAARPVRSLRQNARKCGETCADKAA